MLYGNEEREKIGTETIIESLAQKHWDVLLNDISFLDSFERESKLSFSKY
jgi:hypothetical protein